MSLANADADMIAPVPRISVQAFCETSDVAQVIQSAMADRRMEKAHAKLHMGGAVAAVEAFRTAPTPNVIVLESTADRDELVAHLDALSEFCDAGTKVLVAGRVNDIVLYRELIGRGVSEYLVWPFTVMAFIRAISQLYGHANAEPLGKIIAVTGVKGGVGASAIAHNIAFAVAKTSTSRPPSSTWILPSVRSVSISTRIRRKGSPRRSSRPIASTRIYLTV